MATMSMGARGRGASLPPTAGGILLNFVMMSLCFSLNHGCVTSCLALASAQLGPKLGGYSSGVLYAFYTLTALLLAPDVVRRLGSKGALDWGLFLYCAYVGSYAVALVCPSLRWPAVLFGAALGGLAAGWNWTAQGDFFGRAAELYAYTLQVERETATAFLSGVFATLYLGLELGLKLVSSFVLSRPGWERAPTALFVIYTCVALGASVGMLLVRPLREAQPPPGAPPAARAAPRAEPGSPKLLLALALMQRDPKILLLAPINTAFGFMASLMNFYVNGVLVKTTMGARGARGAPSAPPRPRAARPPRAGASRARAHERAPHRPAARPRARVTRRRRRRRPQALRRSACSRPSSRAWRRRARSPSPGSPRVWARAPCSSSARRCSARRCWRCCSSHRAPSGTGARCWRCTRRTAWGGRSGRGRTAR